MIDQWRFFAWTRRASRPERRPPRARAPRAGAWALGTALFVGAAVAAQGTADVNQAKANMLWNLAKFVAWPGLPANKDTPLVLTIIGEDDLAAEVAGVLSSRTVNGRPVFVRFARRPQDAKGSQIVYLAASDADKMSSVLTAVDSAAVLTVSDAPGFAAHGGMVGFATEGDKVRFEVNLIHAERNGLKLSAKLLSLARLVTDSPGTP